MDSIVRHNPEKRRFERQIHDRSVAAAYYRIENGKYVFVHVDVPSVFSSQGIGAALVQGVFERLRQEGRKAELRCSFMRNFIAAHPVYADVVEESKPISSIGSFDLVRFLTAQAPLYNQAIAALRSGSISGEHIAILFPRLAAIGTGSGEAAPRIESLEEAKAYLDVPALGARYREGMNVLRRLDPKDAVPALGGGNAQDLHASVTLFWQASSEYLLEAVLNSWFGGSLHRATMDQLRRAVYS